MSDCSHLIFYHILLIHSRFSGRAADIVVGEDRQVYSIHENLLCKASLFFKKALSGPWQESVKRVIDMPDDEPKIFAIYVHWHYSGTIAVASDGSTPDESDNSDEDADEDSDDNMDEDKDKDADGDLPEFLREDSLTYSTERLIEALVGYRAQNSGEGPSGENGGNDGNATDTTADIADWPVDDEYLNLVKAYVLGDKIIDPTFQNATIDAIIEKSTIVGHNGMKMYPDMDAIIYAYDHTSRSARIRELLVDLYVMHGNWTWICETVWGDIGNIPHAFLWELCLKLYLKRQANFRYFGASHYHLTDPCS